jgi:hypothetical protein
VAELAVNVIVMLFVLIVLYQSFDLPSMSGNLPLLISSVSVLLFASVIINNLRTIQLEGIIVDPPTEVINRRKRLLFSVGWCIFLTGLVYVLGFYIGFLIFLPSYIHRKTEFRIPYVVLFSISLWVITMFIFSWMLTRQLYNGLVPIVPKTVVRFIAGF